MGDKPNILAKYLPRLFGRRQVSPQQEFLDEQEKVQEIIGEQPSKLDEMLAGMGEGLGGTSSEAMYRSREHLTGLTEAATELVNNRLQWFVGLLNEQQNEVRREYETEGANVHVYAEAYADEPDRPTDRLIRGAVIRVPISPDHKSLTRAVGDEVILTDDQTDYFLVQFSHRTDSAKNLEVVRIGSKAEEGDRSVSMVHDGSYGPTEKYLDSGAFHQKLANAAEDNVSPAPFYQAAHELIRGLNQLILQSASNLERNVNMGSGAQLPRGPDTAGAQRYIEAPPKR